MNDRFKFRVWDKIHERHIYCDFAGYCSVDYSGKGEKRIVFMPSGVEQIKNGRPFLYAKEDEAEIEQCTGLKDKNGKLIYEGDILFAEARDWKNKGNWNTGTIKTYWSVEYRDFVNISGFMVFGINRRFHKPLTKTALFNSEAVIVGNIHENADLLGEDK